MQQSSIFIKYDIVIIYFMVWPLLVHFRIVLYFVVIPSIGAALDVWLSLSFLRLVLFTSP